ncbi:TolC family protein [Longimicrobium sp.]|uniref:TolC family protein n=1 Tax=Longimicrobium sp. TaxID=2029185 RepID=UPI002E3358AB|nr:TolC family protein [Longimicrobium sp.]HEX6040273.1 TolC family protein [Longimicrobium sp.]
MQSPERPRTWSARTYAAALPLVLFLAAPLGAQSAADPLGGYVRQAIDANLGLRQERLAADRADAAVREARGLYLPSLTMDTRYSEMRGGVNIGDFVNPAYGALNEITGTDRFPTNVDARLPLAQETKLRIAQPLFQPAIRENHRLQRTLRDLQGHALGAATRQLAADVQTAYLDYARSVRVVELYRETLPLLDENLRVAERLVTRGTATPDAVLRARAERGETQQALDEAEVRSQAALRRFNQLLNRDLDTPVEVLPDDALAFALSVDEETAVRRALGGREELRQGDAGIAAAQSQARMAGTASLPTVSLALDYGFQGADYSFGADDDFAVASVVVSWNAFNGGQTGARREQARIEADRARAGRDLAAQQIELQARTAFRSAEVARGGIATAEERLAAARRTYELVERRYQEGIAPQIELIDARTAYTRAGLNLILTRYDYAARWVELERAAALRELN